MLFKAQDVTDSGALMHIYPEVGGGVMFVKEHLRTGLRVKKNSNTQPVVLV